VRTERSRELRRNSTDVEAKLWAVLRGGRLEGLKWRRQAPIGRYFADFACPALRLIVELNGEGHADQAAYDAARTLELERFGWRVVRFANGEVRDDMEGVLRRLLTEVRWARADTPSPSHSAVAERAPSSPELGRGVTRRTLSRGMS
jgi:very-short-patch-repair endonuclease